MPDYGEMTDQQLLDLYNKRSPAANPYADMSDDDLLKLHAQKYGRAPMSTLEDVGRSAATGLGEGVTSMAGMGGDVAGTIGGAAGKVAGLMGGDEQAQTAVADSVMRSLPIIGGMMPTAQIDEVTGFNQIKHEPQTTAGEYARTVGQFVPAAAAMGPGGVVKNALKFGVAPAVVSETAGQSTKGTDIEPYARLLGALGTGVGVAILSRPGTAAAALKDKLPPGVKASDIDEAARLINTGERMGVKLTWPEALKQATNGRVDITDMQRVVEQSKGGRPVMQPFMAERPNQVAGAGAGAMDDLTRGTTMTDPVRAGMNVQKAAVDHVESVRKQINAISEPYYSLSAPTKIPAADYAKLSQTDWYPAVVKEIRNDPLVAEFVAPYADDSVGMLNAVKKYYDRAAKNLANPMNPQGNMEGAAVAGGRATSVRETAKAASPEYEAALRQEARYRQGVLEPTQRGPMGEIAATDDIAQQGNRLFPAKPVEGSEKVVAQTVRRLARKDKDAAFQLVRTNLKQQFDEATQANVGGANEWGGAKFAAAVKGNAQQAKNLEAAIKSLPGGDARWRAFNRFLEVMETTGNRQRPGSLTAFNAKDLEDLSGTGMIANTATGVRTVGKSALDAWKEFKLGKNTEALARIFTDPKAKNLIQRLAAAGSRGEKERVAALLVYYATESNNKTPAPVK